MQLVMINTAQDLNLSRQEFYFKLKVPHLTTEKSILCNLSWKVLYSVSR